MKHYCKLFYINFILAILLLSGCTSKKYAFVSDMSDIETSAIHNAIEIFSKTKPKIYNKDSVFHVTFTDSIFRLVSREAPQPNKHRVTHESVRDTYYENLIAVSISGSSDFQYFLTPDIKIGNKGKVIQTRFIEKDGKLFLWDDDDYPITEELLEKFHKNNLFLEDTGMSFPNNPIDELKKSIDYFFCKDNLTQYKKVITNRALGYYDIPQINCSK